MGVGSSCLLLAAKGGDSLGSGRNPWKGQPWDRLPVALTPRGIGSNGRFMSEFGVAVGLAMGEVAQWRDELFQGK
jgi:hypothetical protein